MDKKLVDGLIFRHFLSAARVEYETNRYDLFPTLSLYRLPIKPERRTLTLNNIFMGALKYLTPKSAEVTTTRRRNIKHFT